MMLRATKNWPCVNATDEPSVDGFHGVVLVQSSPVRMPCWDENGETASWGELVVPASPYRGSTRPTGRPPFSVLHILGKQGPTQSLLVYYSESVRESAVEK